MADSPSPSPSQRPTSRDTDGNVTKKSAQESENSSPLLESPLKEAVESLDLGPAFERARAQIERTTGGALVVSYSRSKIVELVKLRNYERDSDVGFMTALCEALGGHGNKAKQWFMDLIRDGFDYTDAEGEGLWC